MKLRKTKISVSSTIILCLFAAIIMLPFYVMIVGSFKNNVSLISIPVDLNPFKGLTLDTLKLVLKKSDIFIWLKNSFIISFSVAILTGLIGVTAGYAFAKIKFRGKNLFFALVMATMMMPKQVLLIPNFLVANKLGLVDTLHGVILTSIAPAFGVFLSRQFISSLPGELFDAAEIDGCGEIRKFVRIAFPLSLPSFVTVAIFSFFSAFNDYLWQLIMISKKALKTLPIGISLFAQTQLYNKAGQLGIAFLAAIPLVALFVFFQRFFIKGATVGAVKG